MSFSFESLYFGLSVASAAFSGTTCLVLLYIFKDKNQRELDIDCFVPTAFYICFCNLIWNISSSLFGFISVADSDSIECTVQSTVNTAFLKASLLWSVALLFQIQVFVLRPEPVGIIPHYNDDYYREVEKYKRFPRIILHIVIWLIAFVTTMLPMIVTQNVHTDIYSPFGEDEDTWCFLRNTSPVWIISTFDTVLFVCLLAIIIMFFYIHCQITISSTSPSVYHMCQGYKLYSVACFACFGPMLVYLCLINIGNLAGSYSNYNLTYYFNIVTMIMQGYGIVFPLCITLMSTQLGRPILNLLCCRCRAQDPTLDNLHFEDEEYAVEDNSGGGVRTGDGRMVRDVDETSSQIGLTGSDHNSRSHHNNGISSARSMKIAPSHQQQLSQSSKSNSTAASAVGPGLLMTGAAAGAVIANNQRRQQQPINNNDDDYDGYGSGNEMKGPPLPDPNYVYRGGRSGGNNEDNEESELSSAELAAIKIQKQWDMLLAGEGDDGDNDNDNSKSDEEDDNNDDSNGSSDDGKGNNAQLAMWSSQAASPLQQPHNFTNNDQYNDGSNNDDNDVHDDNIPGDNSNNNMNNIDGIYNNDGLDSPSTKRLTFFEKQRLEEQEAKQQKQQQLNAMSSIQRVALEQETEQKRQHESAKSKHYEKMGATFKAGCGSDLLSSSPTDRRRSSKARSNTSHSLRSSGGSGRGGGMTSSSSKETGSTTAALHSYAEEED